jgi:hypothetical protein
MAAYLFYPRFHAPIRSGVKTQTIRRGGRVPSPGDPLFLRAWSGAPYRSKQVSLLDTVCASVDPVAVHGGAPGDFAVEVAGVFLRGQELDAFAVADGFTDAEDLRLYYRGIPFEGVVIRWPSPLTRTGK